MPLQKRKNAPLTGLQTVAFILLWCATYTIGFAMLWVVTETAVADPRGKSWLGGVISQVFRYWDPTNIFLLLGLVVPAVLQTPLIRRFLIGAPQGWLKLTGVGVILSWAILSLRSAVMTMSRQEMPLSLPFLMFVVFTPTALMQTLWLHQSVKQAWGWLLTSLIGTCVFLSIYANTQDVGFLLGGAAYGLMTGVALAYLHRTGFKRSEPSPRIDQGESEYG